MKTPFFLISREGLQKNINAFKNALKHYWPNSEIAYSIKTNSLPWLLKYLKKEDVFVEAVSVEEYKLAMLCGFSGKEIVFNGPIKKDEDLETAFNNLSIINIDSQNDLNYLIHNKPVQTGNIGIRVNINTDIFEKGDIGYVEDGFRFGFAYENGEFKKVLKSIKSVYGNIPIGLHLHCNSVTRSVDVYRQIANYASKIISEHDLKVSFIDIGGGFFGGVKGKPSPEQYISVIRRCFENVVDIRFTGEENYTIDRIEDSGYSYSDEDVYFVQQNGKYLPLDTSAVTTYLDAIASMDLQTYATYNVTEEELASYYLDEPELSITVNYTYTDEESEEDAQIPGSCVVHISRDPEELKAAQESEADEENAESISMFVRVGDSQIVYEMDSELYEILFDASYDALRHKEVFWAGFEDVYQIDVTLEGTEHTLVSELDEDKNRIWHYQDQGTTIAATDTTIAATEETTETVAEETDGDAAAEAEEAVEEALDLTDFQNALNALSASSFTSEQPTEKEEIRLTLYLENENFPKVEIILYRYDGTNCLAVIDGVSVSLIPRSSVMDLVEAVQAIVLN